MMKFAVYENIVIYICCAISISAGFYFSDSSAGLWSMIMLLFANSWKFKRIKKEEG